MQPITIDIDNMLFLLWKSVLILLAMAVVGYIIVSGIGYVYNTGYEKGTSTSSNQITITAIPIATATQTPTQAITFTVLSTSSSGNYEATTTTGQILYCNDYYSWSQLLPRNTYTATITGSIITDIVLIRSVSYYATEDVRFYEWGNNYYQCDSGRCDTVTWKQTIGQKVYKTQPSRGIDPSYMSSGNGVMRPNNGVVR
jgi:hypothetical protein